VDPSQTRAIGDALVLALQRGIIDGKRSMAEILDVLERVLDEEGLDALSPFRGHPGDYARPRRYELAAALNRLRTLQVKQRRSKPQH
ncbi:MAG: ATPase, partial [Thermorudis peleae]|nr:ATPase [Thermorudis peleae]